MLRGEKTATSSLLAEWEADREALPVAGERLEVIDTDEKPVAVIEPVSEVIPKLPNAPSLSDETQVVVERFRLAGRA